MSNVDVPKSRNPVTVVDSMALYEKALNSWSAIDLSNLQKELDEKAIEIQDYQKESLLGRKDLANQTKDFKKLSDDEKIDNFNKLLKAYQNVIDSMNKKNKNVENLFFKIYRSIAEAPDPKPLLKTSLDSFSSVSELNKIKEENKILEEKLLKFADYDKLKEKITQTELQMKELNDVQVKATEDEWKSLLEEKEANWRKDEKEKALQIDGLRKQIQEHEINEKMLKLRLKKTSQALGETIEDDEDSEKLKTDPEDESMSVEENISSNVLENLKNDLDISQKRIKSLETRNEELRREISLSKSKINIEVQKNKQENIKQINNLESENSLLVAKLDHERKVCMGLRGDLDSLNTNFERDIKQLNMEIDNLKKFKNNASDYEEVKKELEILKQIQFGEDNDTSSGNDDVESVSKIESAIVQRNKKLNNDLIELRRKNETNEKRLVELSNAVSQYENEINKLKDTNQRLENDLMNFESSNNNANGGNDKWETMSMISSIAGGSINNGKISPAASIAGGNDNRSSITLSNGQDSSLLPIITQQRDRFRNRNKELEEENKKHFSKIVELKREINNFKNDNRELYEKIRFLQYHQNAKNSNVNNGDIENRYKSDYENELHPIEQFRIMETKRINSNITPWDRIFIQVTRTVLSTPYTRWLFVAYCLSLHLLVMILTFSMIGGNTNTVIETSTSLTGNTSNRLDGDHKNLI